MLKMEENLSTRELLIQQWAGSSIGGFAKQGTLTNANTGNIISQYMGLYGKDAVNNQSFRNNDY